MSKVTAKELGQKLKQLNELMIEVGHDYKTLVNESDRRDVPDDLREELGTSFEYFQSTLKNQADQLVERFYQFRMVLLVLEQEEADSTKGKWRETAKLAKEGGYRTSIPAVSELRRWSVANLSVYEAKLVLQAYFDGMFE